MKMTKRILAILLTVAMLATTLCLPAFAVDSTAPEPVVEQTGTEVETVAEGDIIEIATEKEFLEKMKSKPVYVKDKETGDDTTEIDYYEGNFKLTADIELDALLDMNFSGTLDGDGHSIVFTNTEAFLVEATECGALFRNLTGTVKNLSIGTNDNKVKVDIELDGIPNFGVLACLAKGNVTLENVDVWAAIEYNKTTTSDAVNAAGFFGKLAGCTGLTFKNCSMNGTITSDNTEKKQRGIGGFVGYFNPKASAEVKFESCTNTANITDASKYDTTSFACGVGGFIGKLHQANVTVELTDCLNTGNIITSYNGNLNAAGGAGGFVGASTKAANLTITNCVNRGNVSASTLAGGFLGTVYAANSVSITDCVNYGDVAGGNVAGIIGGTLQDTVVSVSVKRCVNYGAINAKTRGAGIVSGGQEKSISPTIDYCVNVGQVKNTSTKYNTGEIYSRYCTATNCVSLTEAEYAHSELNYNPATIVTFTNKGAGVRIVLDGKGTGLRFTFTMDDASIAMLADLTEDFGAENVKVGAIFLPTELLEDGKLLTKENYSNAVVMEGNASAVKDGYYYASLVNLFENHYETEYSCQSFWSFKTADGKWVTVYANNTESRTIKYVATEALVAIENGQDTNNYTEEQITLLKKYAAGNPTVEATN